MNSPFLRRFIAITLVKACDRVTVDLKEKTTPSFFPYALFFMALNSNMSNLTNRMKRTSRKSVARKLFRTILWQNKHFSAHCAWMVDPLNEIDKHNLHRTNWVMCVRAALSIDQDQQKCLDNKSPIFILPSTLIGFNAFCFS